MSERSQEELWRDFQAIIDSIMSDGNARLESTLEKDD